jgi:hypothetical protein
MNRVSVGSGSIRPQDVRALALAAFAAVVVAAWLLRPADSLSDRAEAEALGQGYGRASFGPSQENSRAAYVCGTVDGRQAVFRDPGGLIVASDDTLGAAVAGWCG